MPPSHEERPRPDEDRVREAMRERDDRDDEAPDESSEDDSERDPDDESGQGTPRP